MPASGAARPLYGRRLFLTPVSGTPACSGWGRSPRCRGARRAPASRWATTLIAGRRPAACARTCPPARDRPAPFRPLSPRYRSPVWYWKTTPDGPVGGRCAVSPVRIPRAFHCHCRRRGACRPWPSCRCERGASTLGAPRRHFLLQRESATHVLSLLVAVARAADRPGGTGVGWPAARRQRRQEVLLIALQSLTTERGVPVRPRVTAGLACFRPARTGREPAAPEGGGR